MNIDDLTRELELSLKTSHDPQIIITPNIDHMQRLSLSDNADFCAAYRAASFTLCDSRILKIAATIKGTPIKNVVPGSDLTAKLLNEPWVKEKKIHIVGPCESEFEQIKSKYQLKKTSHYCPPMGFINNKTEVEKCLNAIRAESPDILFLAVGSPRQEVLALKIKNQINSPMLILCIGASLDFLSGKASRAPKWVQKSNLEWLHRMLSEPRRLAPRYLNNIKWLAGYITGSIK